jgi:hypothetical protein
LRNPLPNKADETVGGKALERQPFTREIPTFKIREMIPFSVNADERFLKDRILKL